MTYEFINLFKIFRHIEKKMQNDNAIIKKKHQQITDTTKNTKLVLGPFSLANQNDKREQLNSL
jgi:hypothetical protein